MKHTQTHPMHVGLFTLDGSESLEDIRKGVTAKRVELDHWSSPERANTGFSAPIRTVVKTSWEREAFRVPKAGDDTLKHDARVAKAIQECHERGAEFWTICTGGVVWGVLDGEYVDIRGLEKLSPEA